MSIILSGQVGETPAQWTTATRPATPNTGQYGFNTTLNALEYYNGSSWVGSNGLLPAAVQTSNFTASAGYIYPVNTTSGAITVTLPASPVAGNQITIVDYAGTAGTNNIIVSPNGNKIQGFTANSKINQNNSSVNLVYVDSTQGWLIYASFIQTSYNNVYSASYLVVAGGGGASYNYAGGGGAGGYQTSTAFLQIGATYTITVGAGGSGSSGGAGTNGSNSSISGSGITTITSIGGGLGATNATTGGSGGSGGGGGGNNATGGSGTAGQGNNGGTSSGGSNVAAAGGGGAGAAGSNTSGGTSTGGAGGAGLSSSITGSSVTYAGGGGGGGSTGGSGGSGGGGNGGNSSSSGAAGTTNSGGGGGGGGGSNGAGAAGGSGVVILSVPTANYTGTTTGSPTVTTSGSNTIIKFTSSGSYTA